MLEREAERAIAQQPALAATQARMHAVAPLVVERAHLGGVGADHPRDVGGADGGELLAHELVARRVSSVQHVDRQLR